LLLWVPTAVFGPASPAAAYPTSTVTIIGHGYGHGIGMSQWGSLGYALGQDDNEGNFTYQQILSHYYGNTTMQTVNDATALHGGNVLVAMTEANGIDTIVSAGDSGAVVSSPGGSAPAVRFERVGTSTFQIDTGPGCGGPWSPPVGTFVDPTASASDGGPVNLCTPTDRAEVHGTLTAVTNSAGASRTVNTVPIEQYVADVAPAESPAYWSTLGGPGPQGLSWGFQQSEAQTVAARSYVEATPLGFGGYADTCDLTCQYYPGMADESLSSVAAALDTAGQVMVVDGTSTVATTEYSSSSGGWTTGAQFPAVPDDGDAICIPSACNPHHTWTVSIPVSTVEASYPQIGSLSALAVSSRNGFGDFGGRVEQMTITGSSGSVSVTGDAFAAAVNLQSTWFSVGGGPPSGGVGGYWISAADGGVFSFGNAPFYGSMGGVRLNRPVVGIAATRDAGGYWEVASDGGVFSFGDAPFHGSTGNLVLNKPVVGIATTPDGNGYWLVASDGGVFSFGDAQFYGSTGNLVLNQPVVGMVPTHDGGGYWLIASDGGLFAFGDAQFHGSLGASPPPTPIVGVAPTLPGGGYWMLEADGAVHAFGDAPGVGLGPLSPGLASRDSPMTAMAPDPTGQGFDAVDAGGQAFAYGDAPYFGDVSTVVSNYSGLVVGVAVHPG
jgi:SpoIID/LytB domain protein